MILSEEMSHAPQRTMDASMKVVVGRIACQKYLLKETLKGKLLAQLPDRRYGDRSLMMKMMV